MKSWYKKPFMCCISIKCRIIEILFTSIQIREEILFCEGKKSVKMKMRDTFLLGIILLGGSVVHQKDLRLHIRKQDSNPSFVS